MPHIEQLAIEVKNNCPAINEVTDFAIKEFIRKFFEEYQSKDTNNASNRY